MKLESLLQYIDEYLGVGDHPDYPNALNGLQVQGRADVERIAVAVDASEATIQAAAQAGADLLVVHHGLFWSGLEPLTGRRYRKIKGLLDAGMSLYSVHLPLDAHPEVGNCALLAREIGLELEARFGVYEGADIGWWGTMPEAADAPTLQEKLARVVDGPVHLIPGGPERVERVAVVTGGGASFTESAARAGMDALVTGEGSHHTHVEAMELGIHVLFGGHYATETFGVKALAAHLAERFELAWDFVDDPTGL